jgi:hypothetical protein
VSPKLSQLRLLLLVSDPQLVFSHHFVSLVKTKLVIKNGYYVKDDILHCNKLGRKEKGPIKTTAQDCRFDG